MARTITAYERLTIAANRPGHHVKLEVRNPSDSAWVDLSPAYLITGDVGEDRDTPVMTARFNLRRKDVQSVAPLVSGSTMNRTDAAAYAPLLNLGVRTRLSFAVTDASLLPGTNMIRWSEQYDNAAWLKQAAGTALAPVVTANYTTSPDGAVNADRVVFDQGAGTTSNDICTIAQTLAVVIGHTYIHSVWLKTNDGSTKVIAVGVASGVEKVVTVTPTWQRFTSNPWTTTGTSAIALVRIRGTYGTSQTADLAVWGSQVEEASVATQYVQTTSTAGLTSWREMFLGRIDTVDFETDPIALGCSGLGAWILDTQIETPTTQYGTYPTGTAMETIMQQIVNDNHSGKLTTTEEALYTPTSPAFLVTDYRQTRDMRVLEALRNVALSIGWDARFRYDAAHTLRLTFMDPGRSRVSIDDTIGPNEYHNVSKAALSIANIRNAGKVTYRDASTGAYATVSNTTTGTLGTAILNSQAKYGRRYFELESSANITSAASAQALIDSVTYDLCDSDFEHSIDVLGFWHVQLYDRHTLSANGDHYDQDQTLGVVGYRHAFGGATITTTIQYAGKVVGAYREWLERIAPVTDPAVDGILATPKVTEDGTVATLAITVTDPQRRFRLLEYCAADAYTATPLMNLAAGTGGWTSASISTSIAVTDTTYTFPSVTLAEKQPKKIAWRLWADIGLGSQVVDGGVERFAVGARPMQPDISYEIRADGTLDVFVRGDSDTQIIKIVVAGSSADDATVDAATLSQGSAATPVRSATFSAAKVLAQGEKFYITAKAYNTRLAGTPITDQGSAPVYVTDQWLGPSSALATVTIGSVAITDTVFSLLGVAFGPLTSYVEAYYREYTADPGPVLAYPNGHPVPGTPLYAGVGKLDVPVMTPGNWIVVTLVAFDALNRMGGGNVSNQTFGIPGGIASGRAQSATVTPSPPNAPTQNVVTAVGTPATTARLSFTTPATLAGLSSIAVYRADGTYLGSIGVSSPSTIYTYDDPGRTQGATYSYYGVGVNTTSGATSAATATQSITMPVTSGAVLVPAPTISVSPYSQVLYPDGAFTITITPASGTPANITWYVEHSTTSATTGFTALTNTTSRTAYDTSHPSSVLDGSAHDHWIRVYGLTSDTGWSTTPNYSAAFYRAIPAANDPHIMR